MSPFGASRGCQPLVFPEQEQDLAVPSIQHCLQCCRKIWKKTCSALLKTSIRTKASTDKHHTTVPPRSLLGYLPRVFLWKQTVNSLPAIWCLFKSPRSSTPQLCAWNFPLRSEFNPHFMFLKSSVCPVIFALQPNPLQPPLRSAKITQHSLYAGCWLLADGEDVCSTQWTGRGTVCRNSHVSIISDSGCRYGEKISQGHHPDKPGGHQWGGWGVAVRLLTFCFLGFPSLLYLSVGMCICLSVFVWSWLESARVPCPSPFYSPAAHLVVKPITPLQDKSQALSSIHHLIVHLPHVVYCLGHTF